MSVSAQCFIFIFAVLINEVCLQVTEQGFIGGFVILPCSSTERPLKQDINVHWRDANDKIVFDIINGKDLLDEQDQQYKNRTVPFFGDEYERGNFSLKLINLTHADAGEFSCLISHSSEEKTVLLSINEAKAENGIKLHDQKDEGEQQTGVDVGTCVLWVCIAIGTLSVACLIICLRRKIISDCLSGISFFSVKTDETVSDDSIEKGV
ncbi:butyrophilin-like protein 10 [Labeo rohita]|uniref:butyrophilin-like protein 10 n=1 Tax=Labeo rohita TaxID=84645 RepID=UPI0021E2FEEB|nr:butyrophilin-like protein 10 [Labeo rohita]